MNFARPHFLIAGLGNQPLPRTRHSVGHYILDSLADRFGVNLRETREKKVSGYIGETNIVVDDSRVPLTLFKHKELMNLCGQSILHACRNANLLPKSVIVIADSLYYAPAELKYKFGGSVQGHRGVGSIASCLRDDQFHRLLIGIGRGADNVKDYVLGPLSSFEKEYWGKNGAGVDVVVEKIEQIIRKQAAK